MAAISAVMGVTVATGCGTAHSAPAGHANLSSGVAAVRSGAYHSVSAQADAQRRQAGRKISQPLGKAKAPKKSSKPEEKRSGTAGQGLKAAAKGGGSSRLCEASSGAAGSGSGASAVSVKLPDWVAVINWAQTRCGTPYLWGGNGTSDQGGRFDCSGLTRAAYARVGIALPRVAQDQYSASRVHPTWNQLLPGDLVFFGTRHNLHHVGIYLGRGQMIHAPRTGALIRFNKVHYMSDYFGATRVARDY